MLILSLTVSRIRRNGRFRIGAALIVHGFANDQRIVVESVRKLGEQVVMALGCRLTPYTTAGLFDLFLSARPRIIERLATTMILMRIKWIAKLNDADIAFLSEDLLCES